MAPFLPYLYPMTASQVTYPYTTKKVQLPGNCEIAYIDEGKGERTLLFIHGLANYAMVWKKNIDYLRQYYRCIAIDLPGNGLSDRNDHAFGIKFFAKSVHDLITELGLTSVCLIGHSMGGQVAMATAIAYPKCAESLILCAPAGFERFSSLEKTMYYATLHMFDFISSEEHSLRKTIETSFFKNHSQGEGIVKELVGLMKTYTGGYYKKMVEACIRSMLEDSVFDQLDEITQHTLILFGDHDSFIPNRLIHHMSTEQLATEASERIKNSSLRIIPDCGHFVQIEKADEVNKYIIYYLEKEQ